MSLAVPKRKVRVEATLQDGPELHGDLFLDVTAANHTGPQSLSEYLAQPESFVPLRLETVAGAASGEVVFLAKSSIARFRVKDDDESGPLPWDEMPLLPDDEDDAPHEVRVRIEMRGGQVVEGEMVGALPPERRRLTDYLNQPGAFLALREGDHIHIVNKSFVASARPGAKR